MSRLVARILLSIFLFPLAAVFYGVVAAVGESTLRGASMQYATREGMLFVFTDLLTWAFVACYWLMLWGSSVPWQSRRITGTVVLFPAAAGGGTLAAVLLSVILPIPDWSFGAFIGGSIAILLWLVATVFLWRETAAERAARFRRSNRSAMVCPTCGYNLTGLRESRCPECGSQFTLDELVALQPKAEVDVE